ncbi:hypothetical protein FIBSPDRAFT_1044940 [Athelia psychrophila]|uniref:TPR-like protein n=1 Tax=Athelia psychrophila TaxID=1759441 RepID=A0A166IYD4_9AGAM|nr:hypothetical protein FIBSPDRAFT_1044940 [Fibularhizoctonia sp. CBS 109695]
MQLNHVSCRQEALTLLRLGRAASKMPQGSVPALKVPDAPRQSDGVDTTQLLARITERHMIALFLLFLSTILRIVQEFLSHHNIVWIEIVSSESTFCGSLAIWHWLEVHAPELKEFDNNESQASMLLSLSNRLEYAGRLEEALTAIQVSISLCRILAAERPAAYNAELADPFNNVSLLCLDLVSQAEALAGIQEAVDLRRALAAERPAAFNADLAMSLNNISLMCSDLGRREDAQMADREALGLYRALAAERPATYNADLAMSLNNMSLIRSDLGRQEDSMSADQEALLLYRTLAAERPAAYNVDLGRQEDAMTAAQEALGLYRTLAAERPAALNAKLARSLDNMSSHLSDLDRQEEALAAIQEAVGQNEALGTRQEASSLLGVIRMC